MPKQWQCDDCGARYAVAWLSHCPRCEAMPPPKRAAAKRGKSMPKANKTGGASSAWERVVEAVEHEAEKVIEVLRGDDGPELAKLEADGTVVAKEVLQAATAPAAPAVAPAPTPGTVQAAPAPVAAPAAPQSAPAAAKTDGAA